MKKVYAIGETVFDIIFKSGTPLAATPGGSTLNSAVTLGRLGIPVYFISEIGNDAPADLIRDFLSQNNVRANHIYNYDGKSSLALAFLDHGNNAQYTFHKQMPSKGLPVSLPTFRADDFLLFGSYYAIDRRIRRKLFRYVRLANSNGVITVYDPNFRKSHLDEVETARQIINENFDYADVVRASDEDFKNIFHTDDPEVAYGILPENKILVFTCAAKGVHLMTPNFTKYYPVRPFIPISTIGAGDTFNAALIFGLYKCKVTRKTLRDLPIEKWDAIIEQAITFSEAVCQSFENYLPSELAAQYQLG
ncbi:MAG: carbohydrate kinase [Bacteroidota bacterium]